MSWILIVAGAIVGVVMLSAVIATIRKGNYAKSVYREVERLPDAGFIMESRYSPDEELKMQVSMLEIDVLKNCYAAGISPENAAKAMAGAVNEMFAGGPPAPMQ